MMRIIGRLGDLAFVNHHAKHRAGYLEERQSFCVVVCRSVDPREMEGPAGLQRMAYADADMNVLKTAEALTLHPNTIYARMQKIKDLTGRNPLSYSALTELLLVTDCAMLDR